MTTWRSLGVLAGVVAVLAGCGGGSDEARPDLAFVSSRDGDYAIYEMNADGGAQRRLTEGAGPVESPARLFFQLEPAWSPDAARIAFSSRRRGTFDIFVMRADGTGTKRLTSTRENDSHPTWSSTGDRIAFARDNDIYVMRDDGSAVRLVSDARVDESEPAWSPDGEWIAYVRREPGTATREVWLMRPDGSDRRRLTRQTGRSATPAWSPDSSRIVFATNRDGDVYELFTIGVDGTGLRSVVPTAASNFEPSWSPDGTKIAYQEEGAIYTVELGGGEVEKLTDSETNDSSPAWNPRPPADEE
jgi:Tol biopolymer transport system component